MQIEQFLKTANKINFNIWYIKSLLMMRTLTQVNKNHQTYELFSSAPPLFSQNLSGQIQIDPKDIQQCKELIEKITSNQPTLHDKSQKILQKVKERVYNKGIGFYNAKNIIFMQYLINLQFYELFRLNAVDLTQGQGLELYKRLVYLKTLLLKLEPVEKKLDYQKNKMLRVSDLVAVKKDQVVEEENEEQEAEGQEQNEEQEVVEQNDESQEEDPLAFQPRPQSLLLAKQKKDQKVQKQGKYVAPKISAVLSGYDKKKRKQELQEERKKAFLIRKYRDDLIEDDEAHQTGIQNEVAEKIKRKFRQKTSLEEDNFMRLPESKKEKFWKKQLIQKHARSDPLKETLKEVQTIGQIYRTQVQQQRTQRPEKSQKPIRKHPQSHKTGFKKQKRQ